MLCPHCKIITKPLDEQGIMAAQCAQCQGIWVSKIALDRLTQREAGQPEGLLTANGPSLPDLAARVTQSDTKVELECPYCAAAMVKERVHSMIPVQTDRCPKCDYVWLDAGEQDLLLRLYREMMHDDDPEIAAKRGKLAQVDAIRAARGNPARAPMTDDFSPSTGIVGAAFNTGLNIASDLTRPNAGADVAVDVAEFLLNLLAR